MKAKLAALAAACVIALASACASPSPSQNHLAIDEPAPSCYWLSNEGQGWVAREDLATEGECFAMDSCSGGLGASGGGCYKWATSTEAPARPWSPVARKYGSR